jgi:hypothetical protein
VGLKAVLEILNRKGSYLSKWLENYMKHYISRPMF